MTNIFEVAAQLQEAHLTQLQPFVFSPWSGAALPHSGFASQDFLLDAGMVVLQPSFDKAVIVYDCLTKEYFLPRGRKDRRAFGTDRALRGV